MKFKGFFKHWSENCSFMSDCLRPHVLYSPWNSPGQNTGVGSLPLCQGIFQTQGSNPGLLLGRWILYQLSHQGSPRILEWVACPFSSGSSWPRNWTRVSYIAGGFFSKWAIREALQRLKVIGKDCLSDHWRIASYPSLKCFHQGRNMSQIIGLSFSL